MRITRLIGGPVDGAEVAMDDYEMEFAYTAVERFADGFDYVRHRWVRDYPGEDLTYEED